MTDLQQNRYDKLLRRVGGLIGAKSMVSDALGELFPTIDVELVPSELLRLSGTRLGMAGASITGAAAEFAKAQLVNPANSNLIVTITDIWLSADVPSIFRVGTAIAPFLTTEPTSEVLRDTRDGHDTQPAADIRTLSDGALGPANLLLAVLANTAFHWHAQNDLMVLSPGTAIFLTNTNANATTQFNFFWRERVAEESEFQF